MSRDLLSLFPASPEDVPVKFRRTADDTGLTLLLGGTLSRAATGKPIRSAVCFRKDEAPPVQAELGPAALASADDSLAALAAAVAAWKGGRGDWPRASTRERVSAVRDFAARALPLRETIATALMWEVGKPYAECLTEFDRTFEYVEKTCAALVALESQSARPETSGGFTARIRRAPLGVTLCMGPYNYALNEVFTLVIPALIMGNPVIIKTPRYGVLANALLAPALAASFPAGVANLLTGDGATIVGPLMESGAIDVLAFIGSQKTAGALLRQHPHPYRLRTVLGMGAKNPAIVLPDADIEATAKEIVSGALTFNGQRCTALKQVLVDRKVESALVEALAAEISRLRVGMPWEEGVTITPLPDPNHPAWLDGLVDEAVERGARVVCGGAHAATLYEPALVAGVPPASRLFVEEQFGPIVPVSAFDHPMEAVDVIDRGSVGQQASIFGRDPAVVGPLVDHLANLVCRVNLNTQCRRGPDVFPFTGRKDSAIGTLSINDALRVFSIRSLVATKEKDAGALEALEGTSAFLSAQS